MCEFADVVMVAYTVDYGKMHINGTSQKFMHCVNYAETNVTYL